MRFVSCRLIGYVAGEHEIARIVLRLIIVCLAVDPTLLVFMIPIFDPVEDQGVDHQLPLFGHVPRKVEVIRGAMCLRFEQITDQSLPVVIQVKQRAGRFGIAGIGVVGERVGEIEVVVFNHREGRSSATGISLGVQLSQGRKVGLIAVLRTPSGDQVYESPPRHDGPMALRSAPHPTGRQPGSTSGGSSHRPSH